MKKIFFLAIAFSLSISAKTNILGWSKHTLKIFESIPNAQLAILPNSSHSALIENSKLFNEIVLRFLTQ